jgi:hypothetical protein
MYNSGNSSKNVTGSAIVDGTVEAADLATAVNNDIADGVAGKATADLALPKAGGALTGAVTTNSTFDGRDVATDGAALDVLDLAIASTATSTKLTVSDTGTDVTGVVTADGLTIGEVPLDANTADVFASIIAPADNNAELWIGSNDLSLSAEYVGGVAFYNSDNTAPNLANLAGMKAYAESSNGAMRLAFYAGRDTFASDTPALEISSANDVTVETGNLVIGTSGKGIDFSGVGTAAEILDNYKEGSYTVNFYDASTGGNVSTGTAVGYYTRIGNQVTVTFSEFNAISTGMTAGNTLYISLPYATSSVATRYAGTLLVRDGSYDVGYTELSLHAINSVSRCWIEKGKTGASSLPFIWSDINTGATDLSACTLTYFV